jgi:hypothetical protein
MIVRSKDKPEESDAARDARRAAEHAQYIAEREEAMIGILRMMCDVRQAWRRCTERTCRRNHKCCGGPDFACIRALPPNRATEQEKADAMAELQAGLKARLLELEAAAAQDDSAHSAQGNRVNRHGMKR